MNGLLQQEVGLQPQPRPFPPKQPGRTPPPFTKFESLRHFGQTFKLRDSILLLDDHRALTWENKKEKPEMSRNVKEETNKMYNTQCQSTNIIKVRGIFQNNSCGFWGTGRNADGFYKGF